MQTHDTIGSRSTRRLASPASGYSSLFLRAFLPIFAVFAGVLFSTEAALGQETDRYTKVAKQLVELINAGDYAGIQTNFTREMDAALPVDKSSGFFKGLTQQMGKLQKLGNPQSAGEAMVFPAEFEKGTLDMQLTLDSHGLIAGLNFTPHVAREPAPEKHQTQLSLPFKGRWLVFWGGDTL